MNKPRTDYTRFLSFFSKMGVKHTTCDKPSGCCFTNEKTTTISTGQAIFCFNRNGEYLGVGWDDMGIFDERLPPGTAPKRF